MAQVSTIGLDLAKNVFQVHGIDAQGKVLVRRPLRRAEVLPFFAKLSPCLGRHGSLRHRASLGARADEARPYRQADAAGLREALRQARQDRCGRRRGDRGSRPTADHALRRRQDAAISRRC